VKAIEANYFDYMAHWFLGDAYHKAGTTEKAQKEILIANILNRNNPRIQNALGRIYADSRLTYPEWVFSPRCDLKDLGNNKVSVKYDQRYPEWLPYSLCKALWQFEPGYRESMLKDSQEHPAMIEEKECAEHTGPRGSSLCEARLRLENRA
jgi:hypothetical protein